MLPLDAPVTAASTLPQRQCARGGWPVVRGGSANLIDALVTALADEGVAVHVDRPVRRLSDLPLHARRSSTRRVGLVTSPANGLVLDTRPASRSFNADPEYSKSTGHFRARAVERRPCRSAATVHVANVRRSRFVREDVSIVGIRRSRFASSCRRACGRYPRSGGQHTLWRTVTCQRFERRHDERIENQIERFAPDFAICTRTCLHVDGRRRTPQSELPRGDITAVPDAASNTLSTDGALELVPHGTPGLYLCSRRRHRRCSRMCGYGAARTY